MTPSIPLRCCMVREICIFSSLRPPEEMRQDTPEGRSSLYFQCTSGTVTETAKGKHVFWDIRPRRHGIDLT